MIIKIIAGLSAISTALTVLITSLSQRGAELIWLIPLLFLGYYVFMHIAYVIFLYVASELTIKLDREQKEPSRFWSRTLEEIAVFFCMYGRVRLHLTGMEKLPEGRFLMVCNHRSYFDPLVKIPVFKKYDMQYISKPANFRLPIGGKLMHAYGCLPLDRDNNREALKTIKRASALIDSGKSSVCIYPEGTRSKKDELLPFHAGSFKIAQKSGVPVVVVTLHGTDEVEKNFPFRPTDVYLDITAVIDADFVKTHKTQETASVAQEIVQRKYNELKGVVNAEAT